MIWSPIDIARLFREAGITNRENREIAVAVCRGESGFNDQAKLDNTTLTPPGVGIDRGLMQINSHWHPGVTDEEAYDPVQNIAAAVAIYRGRGNKFTAWVVFNKGLHVQHLPLAKAAVDADLRITKLQKDLAAKTISADEARAEVAALIASVDHLAAENETLTQSVATLQGEVEGLASEKALLRADLDVALAERDAAQVQAADAQRQLADMLEDYSSTRAQLLAMSAKYADAQEALDAWYARIRTRVFPED